jgi:hypothetical protein
MKLFRSSSRKRGYTLTEILIASSISVAVGGAAMWFLVEGSRSSVKSTNTSINDLSQWSIFTAISVDSKTANGMAVYKDFTKDDMKDSTVRLNNGERGNVLILTRGKALAGSTATSYTQVTGYVFTPSKKTLRKFVYNVPTSEQGDPATNTKPKTLEEILVDNFDTFSFRNVADNLQPTDSGVGVFLVRERGHSGILTVESIQGDGNKRAVSKKLIDASFFIRG